jgi:hypothetical protein
VGVSGFRKCGKISYSLNRCTKSSFYFRCINVFLGTFLHRDLAYFATEFTEVFDKNVYSGFVILYQTRSDYYQTLSRFALLISFKLPPRHEVELFIGKQCSAIEWFQLSTLIYYAIQ